jgi:hypothetical protein
MPTPFPGMDPYLEHPALWPDVHNSLIVALRDAIAPQLRPRYYVAVEERIYTYEPGDLVFTGRADVAVGPLVPPPTADVPETTVAMDGGMMVELAMADMIRETYLEVRAVTTNEVVTVLEILSPTNKRPGEGRDQYLRKRRVILSSLTHLVEIDLLRSGEPMPLQRRAGTSDYQIMISRATQRPQAWLIRFNVQQFIPTFQLPLYPGDPEPVVDLNRVLHDLYERGSYDLRLNYHGAAEPPLSAADDAWAAALLREAGLR